MTAHRLEPLINPASIAILGASADPGRVGGMPLQLLLQHRFAGPIYPINPKYQEISGLRCYPDIEALPGPVDLIALAVAAREVVPQLRRAAAKGIRSAIVFASGFAETNDAEGRRLQDEFEACVAALGIPVAGPNCMGFANLKTHAYTAFASVFRDIAPPESGHRVALVTQSGNVCAAVYAASRKRDVRFSSVINTGNEAGVEFSEYLEYFADQPETETIAGYVEGLRDGERFRRVAERLRREMRPFIILKIGDTAKGAEAAASHTASLAGSQKVYRAVFDDLNVMMADDLAHMADLVHLSGFRARRAGSRVAILTISGALGALLSDKFVKAGADVPTLPAAVQQVLRAGIPDYGMVSNPVDLTGNVVNQHGFMRDALAALQACEEIDTIVVYAPGYLLQRLSPAMIEAAGTSHKLIAAIDTFNAKNHAELEAAGIPVFDDTARAVAALSIFGRWSERAGAPSAAASSGSRSVAAAQPMARLDAAIAAGRRTLDEVEGKQFLSAFGLPVAAERIAASAEEAAMAAAELGWPVVVKVLSPDIPHKSDCGGVRLGITSADEARAAFQAVTAAARHAHPAARILGVVVQTQEPSGAEVLVGVTRDPVFGPVMTVGLGGVFTEILGDVEHRTLPVDAGRAEAMVRRLKAFALLDGARGRPKCDVPALCAAMAALSEAVLAAGGRIAEIEINPLIVREQGRGVVALDALVVLNNNQEADVSGGYRDNAAQRIA
ncbi:succinyl-CoA synthetase subunit beta [bacterium YEK0313]|nr:succinyl-CoA synthetase subunit beta [bacterium YEK0313]